MQDYEFKELVQKALNRAYFFLKFRPRTRKEVIEYLNKKAGRYHWPQEIVTAALADLEEQGFINDHEFIEWFVTQRSATKPKSKFALRSELVRLGAEKDLIEEYFAESPLEEEHLALDALKRKWYQYERLGKRERYQKASAFLARRGFSFDKIRDAIRILEGE